MARTTADRGLTMDQIVRGHWLMVGCAVLYLVWWCIFFAPDASGEKPSPTGPLNATGVVCIALFL